uniref:Ribosome biogenesis protein NOP53 n=1 Tax=Catharus ustulatus TaxID=91951 RepID=A0A8C3UT96_CATUS
ATSASFPPFTRLPHEMAAAESFLAFNPAARPGPAAASRRRYRGPRNRKKGWKRWSGPEAQLGREIGDFLEDVGLQERAAGGLISEQIFGITPNYSPSKIFRIIFGFFFFCSICAHQTPNGRKEKRRRQFWEKKAEKGIFPREERKLRARLNREGDPKKSPKSQKPPELGRFCDPLSDPLDAPLAGQDPWFLQQTKKMPVQRPPRLQVKPSPLPPVEVIGQGGSYNPPFQDHQVWGGFGGSWGGIGGPGGVLRGFWGVLGEFWGVLKGFEGGQVQAGHSAAPGPVPAALWAGSGVTRGHSVVTPGHSQDNDKARSRLVTLQHQALFQLRSLRRSLRFRDLELRRRRLLRERRRKILETAPKRLGRQRWGLGFWDLGFGPEGSVLRDRFKSLQRRNLIEPRARARSGTGKKSKFGGKKQKFGAKSENLGGKSPNSGGKKFKFG